MSIHFFTLLLSTVMVVLAMVGPAWAAERPKVGLVLSGGAARGLTHVGVLKVLERERIPVDVIAGTSMGAIVGGLYASGMSAQEIEAEVRRLDWDEVFASRVERREISQRRKEQDYEVSPLLELGLTQRGLVAPLGPVSTRGLEAHLRRLSLPVRSVQDFDRLPTPFRAVATDMETGQAVIMQRGDLAAAMRSSMSVPGVFAPVEVEGRILGDGGLVDNTPVGVARAMGAQRLIVVNIGTPLAGRDELNSLTGLTGQVISLLIEQNVQRSLASLTPQDVLVAPVLEGLTVTDFNRGPEFIAQGELQTEALVLRMQDLKVSEAEYEAWRATRARRLAPSGPLLQVRFEGTKQTQPEQLAGVLETRPGQPFDVSRAERDLRRLAATGDYTSTDYRLERLLEATPELAKAGPGAAEPQVSPPPGSREGLVFMLKDKPWGPDYLQLGLDLRADTQGRNAFNLKLAHNRHWATASGAEWRNFVQLGSATSLRTEWYQPLGWTLPGDFRGFLAASGRVSRRSIDLYQDPLGDAGLALTRLDRQLALELGLTWRELGEIRLGRLDQTRREEPDLVSAQWPGPATTQAWHEQGWRWRAVFDQLDAAFFPSQGWRVDAQYTQGRRWGTPLQPSAKGEMSHWDMQGQAVTHWGPHIVEVSGRLAGAQGALTPQPRYGLGGFQQLSGFAPDQLSGQQVALLRLGYALRLGSAPLTRGLFVGGSAEWGRAWAKWSDPAGARWYRGGSLYIGADTALGPVYGGLGAADGVRPTLMLVVGRP